MAGILTGDNRQERIAQGVVGGLAGGALGYNACVQAYRRQYALQQRFSALEVRLAVAEQNQRLADQGSVEKTSVQGSLESSVHGHQAGVVPTSTSPTRGIVVQTRVERGESYATSITVSGPALFAPNEATLLPSALPYFQEMAEDLVVTPLNRVVVMGHVDPSERLSDPQGLSQQRAEAVVAYLVRRGVNPDNLVAQGLGTNRLADPSGSPGAPVRNRRIEVVMLQGENSPASSTNRSGKAVKS